MSNHSASAAATSSGLSPRSFPRMKRPSSSRPTLASHLGDSGKNQTIEKRNIRGMIWNAIGNLQRIWLLPPSIKDRPLRELVQALHARNNAESPGNVQFEPVGYNDTKNIQSKFNGNELSATCVLSRLG